LLRRERSHPGLLNEVISLSLVCDRTGAVETVEIPVRALVHN
jgi:hypothetical protein